MDLIGRISNAIQDNLEAIKSFPKLAELLTSDSPLGIKGLVRFPDSYFPGPLEGGNEAINEMPAELKEEIAKSLVADPIEPNSFNILINATLLFKINDDLVEMAAQALRNAKYYVRQRGKNRTVFPLLSGLAVVASSARSRIMADEIRVLTRRSIHQPGLDLSIAQAIEIALISSASNKELNEWCTFVGEWLTELSFENIKIEEARRIYSFLRYLTDIEPNLWPSLGKAEAALSGFIQSQSY
jgi:hypothetical protein